MAKGDLDNTPLAFLEQAFESCVIYKTKKPSVTEGKGGKDGKVIPGDSRPDVEGSQRLRKFITRLGFLRLEIDTAINDMKIDLLDGNHNALMDIYQLALR